MKKSPFPAQREASGDLAKRPWGPGEGRRALGGEKLNTQAEVAGLEDRGL